MNFEKEDIITVLLLFQYLKYKELNRIKAINNSDNTENDKNNTISNIKKSFRNKINNICIMALLGVYLQNMFENDIVLLAMLDKIDILSDIDDMFK